jgi:hypothetical protein
MPDKQITSISDMIKELKKVVDPETGPTWFRGHVDASWKLEPHYDRLKKPMHEPELLNRFRQNANLLLSHAPLQPFEFGWMFLMQHYGVPTRLLDWTESPLVALYFAITDKWAKHKNKNGALWVLSPLKLNGYSTRAKNYIPSFDDEWLANYSVEQYSKGKDNGILPIAAIATRNNPRIQAQLGVFTISHLKKVPIEEIEDGSHCVRFVIPRSAKPKILEELQILGISQFQIFPELSSIGDNLREELT